MRPAFSRALDHLPALFVAAIPVGLVGAIFDSPTILIISGLLATPMLLVALVGVASIIPMAIHDGALWICVRLGINASAAKFISGFVCVLIFGLILVMTGLPDYPWHRY